MQAGVANVDLNGTQSKINRGFSNLAQSVKEKTGSNVDITELPQEYLDLERRVDALKAAHVSMLKVAKGTFQQLIMSLVLSLSLALACDEVEDQRLRVWLDCNSVRE